VLPDDFVTGGVSGETLCVSLHDTEGFIYETVQGNEDIDLQ
jgi:hypothetical protein